MISVEINNKIKAPLDSVWLKRVINVFSHAAKIKNKKNLSLALVDAKEMKKLNYCFRGKNKVTDVLSFAEADVSEKKMREPDYLGEIIICFSQAKKQAKEYGHPIKVELARLLVHGLAHLLGYEHEAVSKKRAEEMEKFEAEILSRL